jgi:hypothetical protein
MGKNDWAIVVGIDTYFDSTLPALKGPENDAREFYEWVVASDGGSVPKDQAFCILSSEFKPPFKSAGDAKPTANEIKALFDRLRAIGEANAEKGSFRVGDRIYLFFAGHGFAPSHRQDQTALLVADADTANSQLAHILGTYMADTLYQLKLFDEIFLFMDCCRSSSECAQLFMPYPDDTAPDYWKTRRFYAYGARAGQEARERDFGDGRFHGIFTRTLLDGLRGAAYDPDEPGKITAEALQNLLYNAYPDHMDPELRADPDVPNEPEVVFERKPAKLLVAASSGMVGKLSSMIGMNARPTFAVTLRTRNHVGRPAHVLDKSLRPVQSIELAAENALQLERGLYTLFVEGAPPRNFEVTGASGGSAFDLDERTLVQLEVTAADAATELYVIDGDYNLVGRGIGTERFKVAPGMYKIKARSGIQQEERLVIVSGDRKVEFEPLPFTSPIPLANTAGTTEAQIEAAERAVTHVDARFGEGSSIVIVVSGAPKKIRLRRLDGSELAAIPEVFQAVLDPGGYRLAIELPDGRIVEQTLVAAPGWQTRVFIPEEIAQSAVSLRKEGTPFDRDDVDARLEEIARQAIVHGRKVLSDDLRARLVAPGVSPMLGILGMHLLIREAKRNKLAREENPDETVDEVNNVEEVRIIVANLRAALGKHPDVEAVAIGAGVADQSYAFAIPPMLTLSWRLLLKATAQQPELIPRGSFGEQVSMRLWGDGAWLQWLDPATDRADREAAMEQSLTLALTTLDTPPPAVADAPKPQFDMRTWVKDTMDRFMKTGELPMKSMHAVPFDFARVRSKIDGERKRKLVKQLGVPMAALEEWLASMEKKP